MAAQASAFVTPRLVQWARERVGATREQVGHRLRERPERIAAWETGHAFPAFQQAIRLAQILNIPFGYLYLSTPPQQTIPLPDFRTLAGERRSPTPEFLDLLSGVLVKQEWYREY